MSCKRKRTRAVNDSVDGGQSFLAADKLYSDWSAISSPHKKHRVSDSSRLHQNDSAISNRTYTDAVEMCSNHSSSECHTGSKMKQQVDCAELACRNDQPDLALIADEHQPSKFEDLLLGLISDNECSQVVSQNCDSAAVVKSTGEWVHKADIRSSMSDTSSDFNSDADTCDVAGKIGVNNLHSVEGNSVRLAGTTCFISTGISNSCSKPSAVVGEVHVVSDQSEDNKTDLLQSVKKQSKDRKHGKWTPDCAKLHKSQYHEGKLKRKRRHMLSCTSPTQMTSDNRNQYELLRKMHRRKHALGAVCGKTSAQTSADVVNHCLKVSFDSIKNISFGESGYCDMPESSKKDKKLTKDCIEFESPQSVDNREKKHRKCILSPVNSMCSTSDNWSALSHQENNTVDTERVMVRNDSAQIERHLDRLGCGVQNIGSEAHNEDGYYTSPTSCNKQNALRHHITSTDVSTECKGSQSLSRKKQKKKRHHIHEKVSTYTAELPRTPNDKSSTACATSADFPVSNDHLEWNIIHTGTKYVLSGGGGHIHSPESEMQQNSHENHKKITEVENQCTVSGDDCTKFNNSESTPYKTKSKKKSVSECRSPLACSNISSVVVSSPVMHGNADKQITKASTQTSGALFQDSLVSGIDSSEDVLFERDSCSTAMCENMSANQKSGEDEFEQLLNVLIADRSAVSHSRDENSGSEHPAICSQQPGHERSLSESTTTSDDDLDDLDTCSIAKQCTSVNTQPTSSHTDLADVRLGLCTSKLQDNNVKGESRQDSSQDRRSCSSDRSPSLLQRFHSDVSTSLTSTTSTGSCTAAPRLTDSTVTPDKVV